MIQRFEDLPLDLMRRVDAVCDRFEAALRAGAAPRIDNYLELVPERARPALRGELLALGARGR
jgi:hypothetical protein